MRVASSSDSSDDDRDTSECSSEPEPSSSEDRSECLVIYMVVCISSSSTTRNVTFLAAGKNTRRPVRGLSLERQRDDLRRPEGTGLLRRMLFSPCGT